MSGFHGGREAAELVIFLSFPKMHNINTMPWSVFCALPLN